MSEHTATITTPAPVFATAMTAQTTNTGPLPVVQLGDDDDVSKMDVDLDSKISTTTPPPQLPARSPSHNTPDEEPMSFVDNPTKSSDIPSISYVELGPVPVPVRVPEAQVSITSTTTTVAGSQPEINQLLHPSGLDPEAEAETGGASTQSESSPTSPARPPPTVTDHQAQAPPPPPPLLPLPQSQELDPRLDEISPTSQSPPIEGPQGTSTTGAGAGAQAQERPLNVTDALSYLDAVKIQFQDQPDVYNHFLDIMKDFKSQLIDTPGVIKRVSYLFNGHPDLIQGFNTFLPVGYRIDAQKGDFITVITPMGTMMQTRGGSGSGGGGVSSAGGNGSGSGGGGRDGGEGGKGGLSWSMMGSRESGDILALGPGSIGISGPSTTPTIPPPAPAPTHQHQHPPTRPPTPTPTYTLDSPSQSQQAIEPAVQYVQKIKQRCDADTYKRFLEILSKYHSGGDSSDEREVHLQISRLFKDAPDLRSDFRVFMPEKSQSMFEEEMMMEEVGSERLGGGTPSLDRAATAAGGGVRRGGGKGVGVGAGGGDVGSSTVPLKRKRKGELEKGSAGTGVGVGKGGVSTVASVAASRAKKTKQQHHTSNDISPSFSQGKYHPGETSPRRSSYQSTHHHQPHQHQQSTNPSHPIPMPTTTTTLHTLRTNDQSQFFDRVKRALNSRETYNEFLKLVNLFTQDIIDTARLVKDSRSFLLAEGASGGGGSGGELMRQWREILGWDDRRERESWLRESQEGELGVWARGGVGGVVAGVVLERPGRKDLSVRYGSYRKLPVSEVNVTCSGRDEMCRSVLNDEWVSHPTWSNEDSGFLAPKKNVYEEALHRSEEERHEYDFHIEAIVRTISMLEPINNKIAQLPNEERGSFKLKANLGGSGKSIHQRVIKKIYGREAGLEVIQAMQDSPSLAIPVVLTRLKQKEEEWKRAQREWNKVWREVDARNYLKSLDHQGITFKAADKKAISTKAFVSQVEAARDEQMAKRASLIDPLFARTRPRHHLEFVVDDVSVLQDSLKLTFSFLDRTTHQIGSLERKKIESMLRGVVPTFFMIDQEVFNQAFVTVVVAPSADNADSDMSDEVSSVVDDTEISSVASNSSKAGGGGSRSRKGGVSSSGGGDLRKKLLKSEQAKSTCRKTRAQEAASPSGSRQATPAISDAAMVDSVVEEGGLPSVAGGDGPQQSRRTPRRNIFFSNTTCYVFLRLVEVLYSRLSLFKTMSSTMMSNPSAHPTRLKGVPAANQAEFTILKNRHVSSTAEHFYDLMLESCERLFENDIEQQVFEDQMRYMFGIKEAYKIFTIDKLIGAIIKQVQVILGDPKSLELLELLKKERTHGTLTIQDQINSRQNAERILGPDDNLFRVDWLPDCKTMTVQLLGKDDASFEDSEVSTGRWQAYIDSYVSIDTTENLSLSRMKRPFLRRNISPAPNGEHPKVLARGTVEIKVCVRTYRFFYVSNTEEIMWRLPNREEEQKTTRRLEAKNRLRKMWMERTEAGPEPPASTSS